MLQTIIETNGKKYMNAKTAGDLWGVSASTVRKYCRERKVKDCIKINNKVWYIYIEAMRPLTEIEVHRLLVLSLQLKNDPSLQIDWDTFTFQESAIKSIYNYLYTEGFIKAFTTTDEKRIPYEVILTNKGMEAATSFKKNESRGYTEVLANWIPIIISFGQLCLQARSMV